MLLPFLTWRWQTRMQAKAAQAEDEEISQDNFAQAKVPVISPDVSTYGTLLEEKAARVRELLGEHLTVPLHVEATRRRGDWRFSPTMRYFDEMFGSDSDDFGACLLYTSPSPRDRG